MWWFFLEPDAKVFLEFAAFAACTAIVSVVMTDLLGERLTLLICRLIAALGPIAMMFNMKGRK